MWPAANLVAGIDVGGARKGFHAVLLRDGQIAGLYKAREPEAIVGWCQESGACAVAVDAPCRWSAAGKSREAERAINREGLHCYYTPTREGAQGRPFYQWVFNGERLYLALQRHYPAFDGRPGGGPVCFETFPHAVVCALEGRVVRANSDKDKVRRSVLQRRGFDVGLLPEIDFVDAALCAVAAEAFLDGRCRQYGDDREGYIVVPMGDGKR